MKKHPKDGRGWKKTDSEEVKSDSYTRKRRRKYERDNNQNLKCPLLFVLEEKFEK